MIINMTPFEEILGKLPKALEPMKDISEDQSFMIYQGRFNLNNRHRRIHAEGKIYYSFRGDDRVIVEGNSDEKDIDINEWSGETVKLSANGISGKLLLTCLSIPYSCSTTFRGLVSELKVGKSNACKKWKWAYTNMPYFNGDPINDHGRMERGRLEFKNNSFRIIMENRGDLSNLSRSKGENKYLSHYCSLERFDGQQIEESIAIDQIVSFSTFISFVVGRRQGPFFIQGLDDNSIIKEVYKVSVDDSIKGVMSWKPFPEDHDIIALWDIYNQKCTSKDDIDVLNTAIHWYLESNVNHGMLEGAFVMAFAGLELMYNVLIGEKVEGYARNEAIVGKIADRLNIREKVSPSSIADMRNYLVHYGRENRKKYSSLSITEKENRMTMLLELLELSILYWIGYNGHYHDRILGPCYRGENVFLVPWIGNVNN